MPFALCPRGQVDFAIEPTATPEYHLGTFGSADTVVVLFEDVEGELRYVKGDDDSGRDRTALIKGKLFQGRRYVARLRLYWSGQSGQTAVMLW